MQSMICAFTIAVLCDNRNVHNGVNGHDLTHWPMEDLNK